MAGSISERAHTTRVRGLAPWKPLHATRVLLDAVNAVSVEYANYLPLTVRQIFTVWSVRSASKRPRTPIRGLASV
jgi:hypothetical protein